MKPDLESLKKTMPDIDEEALKGHLPARHQKLLPSNYQALRRGYEEAKKQIAVAA